MKNQNIKLTDFLSKFDELGFNYDDKTGGQYCDMFPAISKDRSGLYESMTFEGDSILFLDGQTFLRTISKTEEHLQVKLFT